MSSEMSNESVVDVVVVVAVVVVVVGAPLHLSVHVSDINLTNLLF